MKISAEDRGDVAVWLLHHEEDHPNFPRADLRGRWYAEDEKPNGKVDGIDLFVTFDGGQALALRLTPPTAEPEARPLPRLVLEEAS